jgi:hypothetical protein
MTNLEDKSGKAKHVQEVHSHIMINFANLSTLSRKGTILSNLPVMNSIILSTDAASDRSGILCNKSAIMNQDS